MKKEQAKKCFVITPIGSDTDPIRRHIEGIIDAAIRPALEEKYEVVVAHKIYEPGSITKQIISEIYSAELVVANLTNRNPNVMYELAFRHCLGKPAIMIAEAGTNLPSDIIMERVIFYQNDAQGVLELRKALEKAESEIDFSKKSSPIHDVLYSINRDINILEVSKTEAQTGQEVLPYILDKLNRLEDVILSSKISSKAPVLSARNWVFQYPFEEVPTEELQRKIIAALHDTMSSDKEFKVSCLEIDKEHKRINVHFTASDKFSQASLFLVLYLAFTRAGLDRVGTPELLKD